MINTVIKQRLLSIILLEPECPCLKSKRVGQLVVPATSPFTVPYAWFLEEGTIVTQSILLERPVFVPVSSLGLIQ